MNTKHSKQNVKSKMARCWARSMFTPKESYSPSAWDAMWNWYRSVR